MMALIDMIREIKSQILACEKEVETFKDANKITDPRAIDAARVALQSVTDVRAVVMSKLP